VSANTYDLSGLSVLVADKNMQMRRLMRSVLRELNIRMVTEAAGTEEVYTHIAGKPFDLIFIEWAPDFDGIAVVRQVRRDPSAASRYTPVILMSAYTELQHVLDARDAGANEFLAKPFTAKLIYSRVHAIIESHRPFVKCKVYFGPDRRRKKDPPPDGWERRGQGDKAAKDKTGGDKKE